MDTQIQDTNAAPVEPAKDYVEDTNAIVARLEAEAKAKREAATRPTASTTPAATVAMDAPTQTDGTPPVAKAPAATKPDSLQQFRDKEGNLDPAKAEQSREHLQKHVEDKEARALAIAKAVSELRKREAKATQEIKAGEKELASALPDLTPGKLSPEIRQKLLSDLEKDPVEAIVNLTAIIAEQRIKPHVQELGSLRGESREKALATELDDIGQNGHPWVYSTEGSKLFDDAFQERPWLLQSRTPYKDALRFINAPVAQQPDAAPSVRSTPTLGGGRAVPPPSPTPTETPGQKLSNLKAQFAIAISQERDLEKANKIGLEIKRLENARLQQRVF